jgi:hypothetical protein
MRVDRFKMKKGIIKVLEKALPTSVHLPLAGKGSLGRLGKDGIVLARNAGHRVHQHLQPISGVSGVRRGRVQLIVVVGRLGGVSGGGGAVGGGRGRHRVGCLITVVLLTLLLLIFFSSCSVVVGRCSGSSRCCCCGRCSAVGRERSVLRGGAVAVAGCVFSCRRAIAVAGCVFSGRAVAVAGCVGSSSAVILAKIANLGHYNLTSTELRDFTEQKYVKRIKNCLYLPGSRGRSCRRSRRSQVGCLHVRGRGCQVGEIRHILPPGTEPPLGHSAHKCHQKSWTQRKDLI